MGKYTWKDKVKAIGPGAVITASFIGPGTITVCTKAGAGFGYALLWTVIFATISTIVLQEMAARLGIITQEGLGEAVVKTFDNPILKKLSMVLVGFSIVSGCVAYIAGDLAGTALGLTTMIGGKSNVVAPLMGLIILALVYKGSFKVLEKLLTVLVGLMAVIFVTTMIVAKPDLSNIFTGFMPTIPHKSLFTVIAIIGTTIVPYNFFIHAASAKNTWKNADELELSKWDIYFSISMGGLITAAIIITSATLMRGMSIQSAADLSVQLEPLLGKYAKYFLSIGLFSAGLSSAIATPLGASYTLAGFLGWEYNNSDKRFKTTNVLIVLFGIIGSATGFNPITLILVSQALNGITLPIIVIYLVYATSRKNILGDYTNNTFQKAIGWTIAAISFVLGGTSLLSAIKSAIALLG
ncbi:MAG: Nramp family divalent metal transporter [Fusobacterium sp. JB021]|nr:Nramp family divalent metal transporter [Fusobacterium sp. JB020]MDP0492784.1 Nramp family divalent metal transporter [Fusobacterium sp. JB021]MDP0507216.1 Nramp family divalent metal transporter [Fusobacterium sp. JB019]